MEATNCLPIVQWFVNQVSGGKVWQFSTL